MAWEIFFETGNKWTNEVKKKIMNKMELPTVQMSTKLTRKMCMQPTPE